jgi:hypothetical protein
LLLAGCGAQVGAAAVVGPDSISTAGIDAQRSALPGASAEADVLSADRGVRAARVSQDRTLLTYAIWHQQLRQAGITADLTREQLDQILANPAAVDQISQLLLATPETLRDRIADTVALQELVAGAIDAGTAVTGPTVDYEYLTVASLTEALDARTRYAADSAAWADDLAAAGADRGGAGSAVAAGAQAALISTGLFSVAEGGFVVVAGEGSATVLRVTGRSVASAPLDPAVVQQLSPTAVNALGAMLLAQGAGASGAAAVEVNPRFGVWDPVLAQVVPGPAQL